MKELSELQPKLEHAASLLRNAEDQVEIALLVNENPVVEALLISVKYNLMGHHELMNEVLEERSVKIQVRAGPGGDK